MPISIKSQLDESLERPWLGERYAAVACLAYPASPITTSTGHIHILCLSRLTHLQPLSHASPSRLESGPRQEKKKMTWIWLSFLGSIPTTTTAQQRTHLMWAMSLSPFGLWSDRREANACSVRFVPFSSFSSSCRAGNVWISTLYSRHEPPSSRLFLRKQPNRQRCNRTLLSSYQDILASLPFWHPAFFTFLGLVLLFSLPLFGIISGYPGFRRFWHKNGGTHEWSPYISLFCFCCFLFSLPLPRITLSTFCNGMRYACISMYSYFWYIDEWLDGRTSYIPRGRIMFY